MSCLWRRAAVSCAVPGCQSLSPGGLLFTQSVLLAVSTPPPNCSAALLRCSPSETAGSHKMVFKGERSAPCSRSPSATSVPLVRDSCSPGAIRSQAEGGMSLTSKSQTGWEGEKEKKRENTHAHGTAQHGTHGRIRVHRKCS